MFLVSFFVLFLFFFNITYFNVFLVIFYCFSFDFPNVQLCFLLVLFQFLSVQFFRLF